MGLSALPSERLKPIAVPCYALYRPMLKRFITSRQTGPAPCASFSGICAVSAKRISAWLDDFREGLRPVPYPDEEALRAELDQIGAPKSQSTASFINTTFLDELKKSGFIDKLYK